MRLAHLFVETPEPGVSTALCRNDKQIKRFLPPLPLRIEMTAIKNILFKNWK